MSDRIASRHIYRTADGEYVTGDNPRAAFLAVPTGHPIPAGVEEPVKAEKPEPVKAASEKPEPKTRRAARK